MISFPTPSTIGAKTITATQSHHRRRASAGASQMRTRVAGSRNCHEPSCRIVLKIATPVIEVQPTTVS